MARICFAVATAALALLSVVPAPADAWSCGSLMLIARAAQTQLEQEPDWGVHLHELERELQHAAPSGGLHIDVEEDGAPSGDRTGRRYGSLLETACRARDLAVANATIASNDDTAAAHGHWYPWLTSCVPSQSEAASHPAYEPDPAAAEEMAAGSHGTPSSRGRVYKHKDSAICHDAAGKLHVPLLEDTGITLRQAVTDAARALAQGFDKRSQLYLMRAYGELVSLIAAAHNPLHVCARVHGSARDGTLAVDRGGAESMSVVPKDDDATPDGGVRAGGMTARAWLDTVAGGKVAAALDAARDKRHASKDEVQTKEDADDDTAELALEVDSWVAHLLDAVHPDARAPESTHVPIEHWLEESAALCEAELYPLLQAQTPVDSSMVEHFRQLMSERAALAATRAAHVLLHAVSHRDKDPDVALEL
eukprot:CAMPEP_0174843510 /NCGR_PEP_ID=MMETSP1114-20130205/10570_1 /TAXON_ID=312471 /ORGANISM="Neobodo designis, Strain CCAP 1951/1" /LENGTH=421 /DNA_ID=CAMNT_0016077735 /DNA_START=32 /DNA_END=1297 /DNA_ORIENTATION=-